MLEFRLIIIRYREYKNNTLELKQHFPYLFSIDESSSSLKALSVETIPARIWFTTTHSSDEWYAGIDKKESDYFKRPREWLPEDAILSRLQVGKRVVEFRDGTQLDSRVLEAVTNAIHRHFKFKCSDPNSSIWDKYCSFNLLALADKLPEDMAGLRVALENATLCDAN